jgi:hypothetical protein
MSREVWFNKLVSTLFGLSNPIKGRYEFITILDLFIEAKTTLTLVDTGGGYHIEALDNHDPFLTLPIR